MNNLGLYIKEALEDNNEIYLLGIGTFKTERVPAYFDEIRKMFFPPVKIITLTTEYVSDFDLIKFLTDNENMSEQDAQSKLDEALAYIKSKEQEEIPLEGLGKLKKHNNSYEFTYTPSNTDGGVFEEYEPVSEIEVLEPFEIERELAVIEETQIPLAQEENDLEEIQQEVSSTRWLWPVIGIAVCAVIAGIWFLQPMANTQNPASSEEELENLKGQRIETNSGAETAVLDSTVLDTIQTTPMTKEVAPSIIKESQGRFEIIIAAFNTMKEAEEFVQNTNSKGYQVYILKNNRPTNLNKISYASFQNDKEASTALAKVRKELNADAWIWENKR